MFTAEAFEDLRQRVRIKEEARRYIECVRSSPPSRNVKSGVDNVTIVHPSRKMRLTIDGESRTVE